MPFIIDTLAEQSARAGFVLDRPLCLNADKTKVVEEDDPTARFVLGGRGSSIPMAMAIQYGLVGAAPPAPERAAAPPPEPEKPPEPAVVQPESVTDEPVALSPVPDTKVTARVKKSGRERSEGEAKANGDK
jgi:hypothetical protein